MTPLIRHLRGLGIALVVLTLTAGAAFAAAPRFQPVSDEQPGTTEVTPETPTPTTPGDEDGDQDGDEDGDQDGAKDGDEDGGEDGDAKDGDEDADGDEDGGEEGPKAPDVKTHGDWVSEAAHAPLPEGFTRGQYVSCVAKADTAAEGYAYPTDPLLHCGIAPKAEKAKAEQATSKAEKGKAKATTAKAKGDAAKSKTHAKAKSGKGKPKG